MLGVNDFLNEDVLQHNCRVGKVYKKCTEGKLCHPQEEWDMVESCKNCKKQI